MERGFHFIFELVGMEPTEEKFNSKLETMALDKQINHKPYDKCRDNVVTNMIKVDSVQEQFNRLLGFIRGMG